MSFFPSFLRALFVATVFVAVSRGIAQEVESEASTLPTLPEASGARASDVETSLNDASFSDGVFPRRLKNRRRLSWSGWASVGATTNATWPVPSTSGYMAPPGKSGAFCGPNQIYWTLERKIDDSAPRWSVGGRVDLLFGADYLSTSSIGLETRSVDRFGRPTSNVSAAAPRWNVGKNGSRPTNGLALPQLYAELSAPFAAGLSVKSGHWYLPIGFESVAAPQNFFYSRSYTATYGNPQTATGLLATLKSDRDFSVFAGLSQPWNVWESSSFAVADGLTFVGGFERTWGRKNADGDAFNSFALAGSRGDETTSRTGETGVLCGVWRQGISEKTRFVLVAELGESQNGGTVADPNGTVRNVDAVWSSVVGYFFAKRTKNLEIGIRAEYFRDGARSRIPIPEAAPNGNWRGCDYWSGTLGGRWTPKRRLVVRPEIRWDYSNVGATSANGNVVSRGIFNDFTNKNSLTVGGDVVVLF